MTAIDRDLAIDALRDAAELHDGFAPLAPYIATAIEEGWTDLGVDLAHAIEVGEAAASGDADAASCLLDEIASGGMLGNWQLAAYEVWRRTDCGSGPFFRRVDGVEVGDSHLLTLGRRIAALSSDAVLTDIDYAAWRTGWGVVQPIADAIAAMHAKGDVCGVEDCLDILTSAVRSGAVEPPRLRQKQYGVLGFAGGLGGFTQGGV